MKLDSRCTGARGRTLLSACVLLTCLPVAAQTTSEISGTVHNQTSGQAAAGDEATLMRVDSEMHAEDRATTDAHGSFSLHVQHPGKLYLVRVIHQGVTYDHPATAGDTLSIAVFDVATRVPGVSASIEILRVGTEHNLLHVSDMYEVINESSPARTQAGERTFEVCLPAKAKINSVLAADSANRAGAISAEPVPGKPGHYAVNFPLRPGRTKFAFNYDVPYNASAQISTWHAYRLEQLAVMIAPSMAFSSRSTAFELLETGSARYRVEVANRLDAGAGPRFEVSGFGALPPLGEQAQAQAKPEPFSAAPIARSSGPPAFQSSYPHRGQARSDPSASVLGALFSGLIAICVYLVLRGSGASSRGRWL
jgi:hypothetical protein